MKKNKTPLARRLGYRIVDFLSDFLCPIIQAVATVWLILADHPNLSSYVQKNKKSGEIEWAQLFSSAWDDWIFWTPAILFVLATIGVMRRSQEVSKHLARIDEMEKAIRSVHPEFKQAWDTKLKTLADNFGFSHKERISVYKHESSQFVLYHRYSEDPEFRKPGRPFYPENEGCIGRAYREGKCEKSDLPCPDTRERDYKIAQQKEFYIPEDISGNFKMKSRSYAAYALYDLNHRNKIAVIVFESLAPQKFSALNIYDKISNEEGENLSVLMSAWKNLEPSLDYAKELGYL